MFAEFRILQAEFDGGFQETQFVSRIVRNSVINQSPEALLFREDAHGVSELDFPASAGLGAFETVEDGGGKNVAAGDGEIRRRVGRLGLFDEIADAEEALSEGRERGGFAGDNAVQVGFVSRDFFDGDGTSAGGVVNIDELLGGRIFSRN